MLRGIALVWTVIGCAMWVRGEHPAWVIAYLSLALCTLWTSVGLSANE